MPTYDYRCGACEHEFEQFQSITAKTMRKCPSCGKLKLKRLIGTGAGVIFKGSGFYETDYRSDSYKKAAKADSDAGKTKDKGSDSKSGGDSSGSKSESSKPTSGGAGDKPAAKSAKQSASKSSGGSATKKK